MTAATSAQLRFLTDAAHLMRQAAPETSAHLMRRRIDIALNAQAQAAATAASTGSSGPSLSSSASTPIAALPQTDIQRQHVCTSCGLILIPGSDGTTLTIQSGLPSQKKEKKKLQQKRKRDEKTETSPAEPEKASPTKKTHIGITKVYKCGLCSKETRISLPAPLPLSKQRNKKTAPAAAQKTEESKPALNTAQTTTTSSKPQPPSSSSYSVPPAKAASNANSKKRAKNRKAGLLALLDKSRGSDSSGLGNLNLSFDDFRKK